MISLEQVSKSYRQRNGHFRHILSEVTIDLPDKNIAVIGDNGMGKSTLLRLISGIEKPDSGRILRHRSVSWPIGFRGSFHREISGEENVRFVSRIFGQNTEETVDFVKGFAELGGAFREPVKTYSTGMVARLAFGVSMAIKFDVYLIDELLAVGDTRFQNKCRLMFRNKVAGSRIVMVSHAPKTLREFCESGVVLHDGQFFYLEYLDDALALYEELITE